MSKKAIIAGASGLIGSKLLAILLNHADYDEVLVLVRKELPIEHRKLVQLIIDFDKLDDHVAAIEDVMFSLAEEYPSGSFSRLIAGN